jgi:hypothetical protein
MIYELKKFKTLGAGECMKGLTNQDLRIKKIKMWTMYGTNRP